MPTPSRTADTKQNQKDSTRSAEVTRQNEEAVQALSAQHSLLSLYRSIGNRAFGQILQAKLAISSPGDVYEQEADRVADQVMATPAQSVVRSAPPHVQRFTGQPSASAGKAPASVGGVLASSGKPLEPMLRQDMEQRFGHDFSNVRVHSDNAAEQSARDINAHAYTVGQDIVFDAGQFCPETHQGRRLIAHELTHVVQQEAQPARVQRHENESAALGKHFEPAEIAKWRESLQKKGYTVIEAKDFDRHEWLKKAFPHKNRRPDMVAVKDGQILVGDITAGPWSDTALRVGDKRTHPNELGLDETRPHIEKTIDDARQLARNLPDDMKNHEVSAQERWWQKGEYSKKVQVKPAGKPMETPAAPALPGPRPLSPPGRPTLPEPPKPKSIFKIEPSRVDISTRGTARGVSKNIHAAGPVEEGGSAVKPKGGRPPRTRPPKGGAMPGGGFGQAFMIVAELAINHAQQSLDEIRTQEEIETEVRYKLAGKQKEIQELFDANVKEIFANVTVLISVNNILGGRPKVTAVSVKVDSKKDAEGSSSEDGLFTTKETHTYSFRLFDVAAERERMRIEQEQSDLAEQLNDVAKKREQMVAESRQGKGPLKPKEEKPGAPKQPPPASDLLKPPGAPPQQAPFSFISGMDTRDPIREAKQFTDNTLAYAKQLIKHGEWLRANSAPEAQRNQWKVAVSQWFTTLRYMKNWFVQQSRPEAVTACAEMLDVQGGELRQIFETL